MSSSRTSLALMQLPLCPSASSPRVSSRTTIGWAFSIRDDPVVEYRVWPIAARPLSAARSGSAKTWPTSPIRRTTRRSRPSVAAMPADSCPRCCRAYSAKNMSRAASLGSAVDGDQMPHTPHTATPPARSCVSAERAPEAVAVRADEKLVGGPDHEHDPGRALAEQHDALVDAADRGQRHLHPDAVTDRKLGERDAEAALRAIV